jgi:hypothetical protein
MLLQGKNAMLDGGRGDLRIPRNCWPASDPAATSWSRRRCSGFAVLRPHGQPSRSCVVGLTVGEFRRRFRGEKLYLFLRPLS